MSLGICLKLKKEAKLFFPTSAAFFAWSRFEVQKSKYEHYFFVAFNPQSISRHHGGSASGKGFLDVYVKYVLVKDSVPSKSLESFRRELQLIE